MTLLRTTTTFPDRRSKGELFMLDRKGHLSRLQKGARLTLGERLLGGARTYFEVDTNPRRVTGRFEIVAHNSRKSFNVTVEAAYEIADAEAFVERMEKVTDPDAVADEAVLVYLRMKARSTYGQFQQSENQLLQGRLLDLMDPDRGNPSAVDCYRLVDVDIHVEAPEGVDLVEDLKEDGKGLDLKMVAATARGETKLAECYRAALELMQDLRRAPAKEIVGDLRAVHEAVAELEAMIEAGATPDGVIANNMRARIAELSGRRGQGEIGTTADADATEGAKTEAPRDDPADRGDD